MDIERMIELLKQTTNCDPKIREPAEKNLDQIQRIIGFTPKLLEIVVNVKLDLNVRVAAVNYLKNNVLNYWDSNNMLGDNVAPDLLGLIASPIPKEFKVALLDCCAAFAKTAPSTALALWNKLELLIPSLNRSGVPTTNLTGWNSGIIADLGDLEPRAQEYSVTISFINMLNNILEHIAKYCMLQSPHLQHSVSLETCINLVTNIVFLRVGSRQFNKIEEKWTILSSCINTYHVFMSRYDPAEDGHAHRCSFGLLSQILQDSDIFKNIMMHIEDAVNHLENDLISSSSVNTDNTDQDQAYKPNPLLDEYILSSLTLLNCIAEKQEDFMELVKNIPGYPTAINVKLDVLLSGVNPRTGSVDRLATFIRIPALTSNKSSLQALRLLTKIVNDQRNLAQQVSLHLSSSNSPLVYGDNLVTLFVNCLSSESKEVRTAALEFISTCLEHKLCAGRSSYNIAHELLGFDSQMTTLREPGSTGKVFDCLHAIINFFDSDAFWHPELKEERTLGLEIIHKLCTDVRTYDLTLRFLRSSYDFLSKYLKNLFKLFNSEPITVVLESRLDEVIWFMRLLSVEIKLSCERNMKSIATNHLKLLLSEKPRKLLELLPNPMCGHTHPEMPKWECFDNDELWRIIAERADGKAIIDLKELHRKLNGEVKLINLHLGSTQKNLIRDEITEIVDFASCLNNSYRLQAKKYEYLNSWRELTETIMSANALECFDNDLAVRILFEITHELMSKTSIPNFTTNLYTQISSTILMAASLLKQIGSKPTTTTNFLSTAKSIQNLLEQAAVLFSGPYKRARVNLYAAFLSASRALPEIVSNDLKFNRSLLEKIYKDALAGPEVVKVLALTILTQTDLSWVEDATKDGSLRHLVESLAEDDLEIVATKGEVITKAFFSFESKVTLFTKIASGLSGAKSLIHLNIMEVLGCLRCIDSYLMLLDENTFFQKLYLNVLQLMSALSNSMRINNKNLLKVKPTIHTEILRNVPLLKNRPDGLETLLVTTSLQSQIILDADSRLKHDFVNSIQHFTGILEEDHLKILVNLLTGCVKLLRSDQYSMTPLFAPSWNAASTPILMSQPSLGTLVSILNNLHYQNQTQNDGFKETVTENCVYLIWCHMNIYLDSNYQTKPIRELESFKNESQVVLNDGFFNKLAFSRSEFVKLISRRLKKLRISIM